jgi:hypothetical protein
MNTSIPKPLAVAGLLFCLPLLTYAQFDGGDGGGGAMGSALNYTFDGSSWSPENPDGITTGESTVNYLLVSSGNTSLSSATAASRVEISPGAGLQANSLTLRDSVFILADASGYGQYKGSQQNVRIQQYIAHTGWHNISMPVAGTLDQFGAVNTARSAGARNIYQWDAAAQNWSDPVGASDGSSVANSPGAGYLTFVGHTTGHGLSGVIDTLQTIDFSGQMYISADPNNTLGNGWNLIANPFTCSLDFNALDVANNGSDVNNSFAIWDPSADNWRGDYVSVSSISSSSQKIAPLQSFWVQATDANASFPVMNMSDHGTVGSSPTYYKSQSVIADRLFLHTYQASNPQLEDELLIGMVAGASDGNDHAYDAGKRIGNNVAPFLMSAANGDELAINAIDYGPLGAKPKLLQLRFVSAKNNEDYFIALEDSLLTNEYRVILEDKKLSKRHDLNSRAYRFTHDITEEYRFVLHLEPLVEKLDEHTQVVVAAGSGPGRYFIIYFKDGSSAKPMEGALYDLQGKRVQRFTVPTGQDRVEVSAEALPTGIYLLKVQTPKGIHAEKILID